MRRRCSFLILMLVVVSGCVDSGSDQNQTVGTPTDGDGPVTGGGEGDLCTTEELTPVIQCALTQCPEETGAQIQALITGQPAPDPAELVSCLTANCSEEIGDLSPGCISCLIEAGDDQAGLLACLEDQGGILGQLGGLQ